MSRTVRVLLAEDNLLVREGLASLLDDLGLEAALRRLLPITCLMWCLEIQSILPVKSRSSMVKRAI